MTVTVGSRAEIRQGYSALVLVVIADPTIRQLVGWIVAEMGLKATSR
jgi:hypothetical protein